ncbi:hypothetical protein, partial [Burkholderia sp. SIMBA_019]|uniref:hypothetical protein n=1 Tax=Burkholderia sp. SIMBA_019 TaxID=3085765 RepID=UPI00397C4F75
FALLMLKAVDRHIKRYLVDSIFIAKTRTLKSLLCNINADIRKGGSPAQTGLDSSRLYGADKNKGNDVRSAPGVTVLASFFQRNNS